MKKLTLGIILLLIAISIRVFVNKETERFKNEVSHFWELDKTRAYALKANLKDQLKKYSQNNQKQQLANLIDLVDSIVIYPPYDKTIRNMIFELTNESNIPYSTSESNLDIFQKLYDFDFKPSNEKIFFKEESKLLISQIQHTEDDKIQLKLELFHDYKSNDLVNIYNEEKKLTQNEISNFRGNTNSLKVKITDSNSGKEQVFKNPF